MVRYLLVIISLVTVKAFSQTVPNGGFESWVINNYEDPQYYQTSNYENDNNITVGLNAEKTTDAFAGNYALKLKTIMTGTDITMAYFANGNPGNNATGGIPYNQKPTGIRFWYKSNIIAADTALFMAQFKKAGAVVATYLYKFHQSQGAYTLFNQTFSPALSVVPDTVLIASASSNAFANSGFQVGNFFQLDSISFKGVNSQPSMLNGSFENWVGYTSDKLNGWNGRAERTTDAYSGQFALELQTQAPYFGSNQVYASHVTTGIPTQNSTLGGTPFTNQQDTLVFFYKYLPAHPQDSARFTINCKKNGTFFYGNMKYLGLAASYQQVIMPINLSQAPDTMLLFIESSKWPVQNFYVGSDLKIDNIYLKSQKQVISNFNLPSYGCVGQPVSLIDASQNMANAWGWIMPGGSPGSSTAQNPVVVYNTPGTKTITMVSNNQFGAGTPVSKTITINSIPVVSANSFTTPCGGSTVVLTAGGANSYTWNTGSNASTIIVSPPVSTNYTVVGTANGCTNSAVGVVVVPTVPKPDICMVTVDSANVFNEIYWDKNLYPMMDSMIVYREVISNNYARIGAVSKNALSMFIDTTRSVGPANGDPNISTYRYKIQIRDTCGQYGPKSSWHNTVYFTHTGGTFFWTNNYMIEGGINPVQTYSLIVCVNPTVSPTYSLVGTTTGNQSTLNDPFYHIYQGTADWRVEANLGYQCESSLRLNSAAVLKATKSRSNVQNNRTMGISSFDLQNVIKLFPNPASENVYLELNRNVDYKLVSLHITDVLGKLIYQSKMENHLQVIDVSKFEKGVYFLTAGSNQGQVVYKLIVN
jgi:hypothetical protein